MTPQEAFEQWRESLNPDAMWSLSPRNIWEAAWIFAASACNSVCANTTTISIDELAKLKRVLEAAKWANFCPDAGGYHGGRPVESCYEELNDAVNSYFGTDIETPITDWITEEELNKMLENKRD